MKRSVFAAAFVSAAISMSATSAWAGEEPVVVDATRVTYYLELGDLDAAKVDALTARLKREFPKAQVERIEGTLRIQTDEATLGGIDKLLHDERIVGLGDDGRRSAVRQRIVLGERVEAVAKQEKEHRDAQDVRVRTKLKVGDLCEGCADCLAAALSREFPGLSFLPEEGRVEVVAAKADLERVEKFLRKLGEQLGSKRDAGLKADVDLEDAALVLEGDVQLQLLRPDSTPRPGRPADPLAADRIRELERRLAEAKKSGREDEAKQLERALAEVRNSEVRMPRFDLDPETLGVLRERLQRVKARLADAQGNAEEREALEGTRRRLEEAQERLEAAGRSLARGGGGRGPGDRPRPPVPPEPPAAPPVGEFPWARGRHDAAGPLAEFRQRVQHLMQAVEHLNAAGYEGLAKQVQEAAQQVKQQAEETARRLRVAEEARAAAMQKEQAARQAEREELRLRERKDAEARDEARRASGLIGPKELGDIRSEELIDLVRALNQQINALREEMRALREQVGRERPAPR